MSSTSDEVLKLLNSELEILGFAPVTETDSNESLVTTCYSLAKTVKRTNTALNEKTEETHRVKQSLLDSLQERKRLLSSLSKEEAKNEQLLNDLANAKAGAESLSKELKEIKAESSKWNALMNTQRLEHEHELRRRDYENAQLRNRIYSFVEQGLKDAEPARIDTVQPAVDEHIRTLHNHMQYVLEENAAVRTALLKIRRDLGSLVGEPDSDPTAENLLQSPVSYLIQVVEKDFDGFIERIKPIPEK